MAYPVLPMSIKTLLSKSNLILPALQRDYVWKPKDICKLFDSLMQEYPINTMMFWQVSNIANQPIAFYDFLPANHVEGHTNHVFNSKKYALSTGNIFDVVIDGQQRITSLLIGLTGSYQTPKAINPSYLYLRLDTKNTNSELVYDFQFLSVNKVNKLNASGEAWLRVSDVMNPNFNPIGELNTLGLINNSYAQVTINKLNNLVTNTNVINYYNITSNNIDDVLEIFIRTNSGGYILKKGDLLMSALSVNWANNGYSEGARQYVEDIIDIVKNIGYKIDKDWVFNLFLMLMNQKLTVKVSAFMGGNVPFDIHSNRANILNSVKKAFDLVKSFHLFERGLTTKLAIIPIVYYIYKMGLGTSAILSTNHMKNVYDDIRKFLFCAILGNLFDARTNDTLQDIRVIIDNKATQNYFPFSDISLVYPQLNIKTNIPTLLATRKSNAFPVLNIIYALGYDYGYTSYMPQQIDYEIDHMHPKTLFNSSYLSTISFTTKNDFIVANDGITYDTVLNLQLLDPSTNSSKNGKDLTTWLCGVSVADQKRLPNEHFFSGFSRNMSDFGTFVLQRQTLLGNVLQKL